MDPISKSSDISLNNSLDSSSNLSKPKISKNSGGAFWVGLGIFLSRIMGLVRQKIFAFYFGNSDLGDAFYAALKIPNFLQNLLGDGVLSASFIPVYAQLISSGKNKEADQVAQVIGSLLSLLTSLLVVFGIYLTPYLIDLVAPGFVGEKKELTIRLVQIFFPGTALLVMSAWCLGILNSHRKFFLSYVAPVIWNLTIIAALIYFGSNYFNHQVPQKTLVIYVSWAVLLGSFFQFVIQLPTVFKVAPFLKFKILFKSTNQTVTNSVKTILKNFIPVVTSRGVVQLSAYIDNILASWLPMGAVSALAYSQSLYMLPISLFGMSVSAAELPAMSQAQSQANGDFKELQMLLKQRMEKGLQQITYFVIPSVVGFWFIGDVIIRALYKGGQFGEDGVIYVWGVLAGSTLGLLAGTLGRLYSSAFYSLKDTKTPLKFAIIRVLLTTVFGIIAGLYLPEFLGLQRQWGAAGLTASAGLAGWFEFYFLRKALCQLIGELKFPKYYLIKIWASALIAGSFIFYFKTYLQNHIYINLTVLLFLFGIIYLPLTLYFKIESAELFYQKIIRKIKR